MQWGPQSVSIKKLAEHGVATAATAGPRLTQWTVEYYRAFNILVESRTYTMGGIGPIPLTEIKAYLDMIKVTDIDEREYWIRMIRVLDRTYVDFMNSKVKRERERKAKSGSRPGRRAPRRR